MDERFTVTFLKDRGEVTEVRVTDVPRLNIPMRITDTMTMDELLSGLVPLILQRVGKMAAVIELKDITIASELKDFWVEDEMHPPGVYGTAMFSGNRGKMIIRNNTKVLELREASFAKPNCWKNIYVHDPTTCRVLGIEYWKDQRDREALDPQAQLQAREDAELARAAEASLGGPGGGSAGGLAGRAGGAPMGARQDAELEAQQLADAMAASEAGHQQRVAARAAGADGALMGARQAAELEAQQLAEAMAASEAGHQHRERARAARAGGTPHGAVPPARIAGGSPPPEAGGASPHEAVPPAQLVPRSSVSEEDIHLVVSRTDCTPERAYAALDALPSVEQAVEHILLTARQGGGGRGFGLLGMAGRFGGSFWDGGKRKKSRKRKSKRRTSKRRTSKRRTSKRRTSKRRTSKRRTKRR